MTSEDYVERCLTSAFDRVGGCLENKISADILHFMGAFSRITTALLRTRWMTDDKSDEIPYLCQDLLNRWSFCSTLICRAVATCLILKFKPLSLPP